ncbi:WD40 repeat-like protein, partial [Hortaea werneckii]
MASRGRSTSPRRTQPRPSHHHHSASAEDTDAFLNTRQLEQFSRTVHATASQLLSSSNSATAATTHDTHHNDSYRNALTSLHSSARRPYIQRSVFSLARASPRELLRTQFSSGEVEQRALSYIPEDLIRSAPEGRSPFSLFEGFRASLPEKDSDEGEGDGRGGRRKKHGRHGSKKLLTAGGGAEAEEEKVGAPQMVRMRRDKARLDHRLEMMGIRKTMCTSEIKEIDAKIANLNTMRKITLDRLAGLEGEEHDLEQAVGDLQEKLEEMQEQMDDAAALAKESSQQPSDEKEQEARRAERDSNDHDEENEAADGFMSESIYERLPKSRDSPRNKNKPKRRGTGGQRMTPGRRKISMPVLHEHMEPGSRIRELPAHTDTITALDFDAPFRTMVTAALDDTVRVWDLSAGRCMGMLDGHLSSVRCLQVDDQLVATGSMDASIRLWDLSQADYNPISNASAPSADHNEGEEDDDALFAPSDSSSPSAGKAAPPPPNAMADCHLFTLSAHVDEVTALHMHNSNNTGGRTPPTLVSGSADKTLRQWDLATGRCVQTLDVLWAAAAQPQPT